MRTSPRRAIATATLVSLVSLASVALADKPTKIEEPQVPKAVVEAVHKKYPGGSVSTWEREKEKGLDQYEAKVDVKTKGKDGTEVVRHVEATLSAEGKILSEEERVTADALPDAVKKAIAASKWATWTIARVERQVLEEKETDARYEIRFEKQSEKEKEHAQVTFDAAGKVVEDEGDDEDDEKPAGMDGGAK